MLSREMCICMEWFSLIAMVIFGMVDDYLWMAVTYMGAVFYKAMREGVL